MPFSKTFAYNELAIRVECPDQAHLTWLEEFLSPAFSQIADEAADCVVTLEVDDGRHAALLRRGPHSDRGRVHGFVLDRGPVTLEACAAPGSEQLLFDADAEVFYFVDAGTAHIRILAESRRLSRRLALMRVVRELAMSAAWTPTAFVLHAAACEHANSAILIAGPKGAGKTTLLMHALSAGDVRFIANDRAVVNVARSHAVARGMPTVTTVGEQTRRRFPVFADRWASSGYNERLTIQEASERRRQPKDATNLTPAQFCTLLDAPLSASAPARVILFPRLTDDVEGMHVHELSPAIASERLAASVFAASSPQISQVFALPGRTSPPDPAIVAGLAHTLLSQVRSFDCVLGRSTSQTAEAVRGLLSTLAQAQEVPKLG